VSGPISNEREIDKGKRAGIFFSSRDYSLISHRTWGKGIGTSAAKRDVAEEKKGKARVYSGPGAR